MQRYHDPRVSSVRPQTLPTASLQPAELLGYIVIALNATISAASIMETIAYWLVRLLL